MSIAPSPTVTLDPAAPDDAPLLANLLELYVHDLSAAFQIDVGADGRFGYDKLPLYWSEPGRRFAFLIHCAGKLAGFAFATRGSPASDDPDAFDFAEFFVLRRYRRAGVGGVAATMLWDRFPERTWVVRVSMGNRDALPFWDRVVRSYTGGAYTAAERPGQPHAWQIFTLRSGARTTPQA